jgi:FKBP-type peptidyl-prolyl cis-trans isomerase
MKNLLLLPFLFLSISLFAQYKKLPSGIEYRIVKKGKGTKFAKMGDYVACKIKGTAGSKVIFSTKELNKGADQFINFQIVPKKFNGDVIEGLMLLSDGDSAVFRIPQDSFFRGPKPKELKPGEPVIYTVSVLNVKTAAQYKKEQEDFKKQQAQFNKMMADQKKQQAIALKAQVKAQEQARKEDAAIKKYIATNNLGNFKKTKSGLYILETQAGDGVKPKVGADECSMNYRGQLLDGKIFDSNIDSQFNHQTPFKFKIGQRQVIAGWDEGIATLSKGSKAILLIPSGLAYGTTGSGANIPANSPLRFDVEVLNIEKVKTPQELSADDDASMNEYFKSNNITAIKTASGMYYVINQSAEGAKPKVGDKLTMNYTGKLLNGTKFDSNVDSTFGHVSPFTFNLGKGQVIRGWDEAMQLLPKGTKATLFIPSGLAYGATPPTPSIPPNSPLVFDVEVVDFVTPEPTPPASKPTIDLPPVQKPK